MVSISHRALAWGACLARWIGGLGPEFIRGVLILGVGPDLGGLAVADVEDLHGLLLKAPAFPLGADRGEGDSVLVRPASHPWHRGLPGWLPQILRMSSCPARRRQRARAAVVITCRAGPGSPGELRRDGGGAW